MTPLLNATEKKQTGLCSFIPKAARVKMQQRSSKDHTDTLGTEGGRAGEELLPSVSKTAAQLLPARSPGAELLMTTLAAPTAISKYLY